MNVPILSSTIRIDESIIAESESEIRQQVQEFEDGERRYFDLHVTFPSRFTTTVLTEIAKIPFGETRSYGEIAEHIGASPIVVGNGCARNPVPLIVPCHRVVGSNGDLRGYSAADGIKTKQELLAFEARENENYRQVKLGMANEG